MFIFPTLATIFEFFMASQRPGRYLKTFLEPTASFSQSMGPFRATATPFMPKTVDSHAFWVLKLLIVSMFFLKVRC